MFIARRLHLQIYATIIATLVLVIVLTALFFAPLENRDFDDQMYRVTGRLTWLALPPVTASKEEQAAGLRRMSKETGVQATLFAPDLTIIASVGPPPPRLPRRWGRDETDGPEEGERRWQRFRAPRAQGGGGWFLRLPDDRIIAVRFNTWGAGRPLIALILIISAISIAVGLGSYPLVRRLTGRLDRLEEGVKRVGAGDLSARVAVEGRDEIAGLAKNFNTAAERIEALVTSNRALLANASHELRTPLARIRMGIELLEKDPSQKRKQALQTDIAELDTLIDEILMMSRLDSGQLGGVNEQTDLLAIIAEEAARYPDVSVDGSAPPFPANRKLLRRLVRNLLDNAGKYGAAPITIELDRTDGSVVLIVRDSGPGIPHTQREKVFQRFYRSPGRQNIDGYGLGLPLVRQIAEAHGGTAEILDETGCAIKVTVQAG
ncbi:MAG: HAMP domain-containing sensor histidine kinase [Pseudomonadota bacterium]